MGLGTTYTRSEWGQNPVSQLVAGSVTQGISKSIVFQWSRVQTRQILNSTIQERGSSRPTDANLFYQPLLLWGYSESGHVPGSGQHEFHHVCTWQAQLLRLWTWSKAAAAYSTMRQTGPSYAFEATPPCDCTEPGKYTHAWKSLCKVTLRYGKKTQLLGSISCLEFSHQRVKCASHEN